MNLLVCIPAYDGRLYVQTVQGLMQSMDLIRRVHWVIGCCQISSARNVAAHEFLTNPDLDKLLFIDSDIVFNRAQLQAVTSHEHAIVAGLYCGRQKGGKLNVTILDHKPPPDDNGAIEVQRVATGFMCIRREGLEQIKAKFPDRYYQDERTDQTIYDFFADGRMAGGRWFTDDYAFCDLARAAGVKVHADFRVRLGHLGTTVYEFTINNEDVPSPTSH